MIASKMGEMQTFAPKERSRSLAAFDRRLSLQNKESQGFISRLIQELFKLAILTSPIRFQPDEARVAAYSHPHTCYRHLQLALQGTQCRR